LTSPLTHRPGPERTFAGIAPSFFVPYAKWDTEKKLKKLLHYFDLPAEEAPSLMYMYIPDVDQAGHKGGPDGTKVSSALVRVDTFVGDLRAEIGRRNMSHIVDLVVLSDHGEGASESENAAHADSRHGATVREALHLV
jgi:predicted AlkP superfamily pyrophosphatase or phosphodiesterase